MSNNCFRFAPRDSVPGIISKICKYLKDHPGWSVEELKEAIGDIETSLALGEVSYFTNQSINDLNITELYDVGYRFVFVGGEDVYSAMYALEESDGVVSANGVSLGVTYSEFNQLKSVVTNLSSNAYTPTNPPPYPVTKVNGRRGEVSLDLSDVLDGSTAQTMLMSRINFDSTQLATWNAFYGYGYRIVGVISDDGLNITSIYILGQNENNHAPIPLAVSSGGNVTSVNGDIGEVFTLRVDPNDPGIPTDPSAPINANTLNGKDSVYYLGARNLLDNSDFRNPVNQRGKTEYTSNGYTIDRWELYMGAVGVSPLGYITTSGQMYQKIDIPTDKVYTFAIENDAGIAVVTGIPANGIHSATLGNALIKLATIGEYVEVVIEPSDGHDITGVYWATLYEGEYTADNLPPYVPKGYAVELAECLRYYVNLGKLDFVAMNQWILYAGGVRFPLPMRINNPTVTFSNPGTGTVNVIGKWAGSMFEDFGRNEVTVNSLTNAGFTLANRAGTFEANLSYTADINVSADL